VSTALLAAIASQGAPVNGGLWYVNYSAILVILLIGVAVALSYLSVSTSNSFCESIFLAVYTPTSQLLNITVNFRDLYHHPQSAKRDTTNRCTPNWIKQLLFVSISFSATEGLTLYSAAYVGAITGVYFCISWQLKQYVEPVSNVQQSATKTPTNLLYRITLLSLIAADIVCQKGFGFMNLAYFTLVDTNTLSAIKSVVENQNIEIMEGLEQYYTEGLILLAEVVLTISAIAAQPYLCMLYIPVLYFLIYCPVRSFKVIVSKINSESLCLSNFDKATGGELSSYNDVCAICLSVMKHARITPCKHIFHGKCLKNCLKKKVQCPMCNSHML